MTTSQTKIKNALNRKQKKSVSAIVLETGFSETTVRTQLSKLNAKKDGSLYYLPSNNKTTPAARSRTAPAPNAE